MWSYILQVYFTSRTALAWGENGMDIFRPYSRPNSFRGFKSVRIRIRIFNIRYRIRIRILKLYIYDVDIPSYPIRHGWYYPYSNPNPDRNMKTNIISVISVRIRSVFIPNHEIYIDDKESRRLSSYLFISMKFDLCWCLCWFVTREKHRSFAEKYCSVFSPHNTST
jgi:hypothetical protein